jgi:hypothetical protein
MKLSALYKLCKRNKIVHILHDEGEERQWIMVEGNMYPTDGLPRMGADELLTMMDVPQDEQDKWIIKVQEMNEQLRWFAADNAQGDTQAREMRARVNINGDELAAIDTDCGVVLIPAEALRPVSDSAKTYELFARKVMGEVWIAVKNGFQLIATIVRVKVTDSDAADCLRMVADRIIEDYNIQKALDEKRNGVQQQM